MTNIEKKINQIKKNLAFYDKLIGSDKISNKIVMEKTNLKFHKLKQKLLEIELLVRGKYIDHPNSKQYLDTKHQLEFLKENVKILEDYTFRWNSAHQAVSIDILTICQLFSLPILLILSYYMIPFNRTTGLKPIFKINNLVLLIILIIPMILLVLFLRSRKIQNKVRNFIFNLPEDEKIAEILY